MNGSDFDDVSNSTQTASYGVSHTYDSQREAVPVRPLMDNIGGLIDFSQCRTDAVEGSLHRASVRGSCPGSHIGFSDVSCKRKNNPGRNCLIENDQHKSLKTKHTKASANLKFACPFFKKDPSRFTRRQACSGPGFSSISRVKEHLYRAHKQPDYQCIRCYTIFTGRDLLEEHQRAEVPCRISVNNFSDGINEAQYIRLRRKPSGQKTDVERWEEIYRIVFPKASIIPSYYYEPQDSTAPAPKNYSFGLKQMEKTLVEGVRKDFEDRFDQIGDQLKADFLLVVKERVETTIQEFLAKHENTIPVDFSGLTTPAESPINAGLNSPPLGFHSTVGFDFQPFGSAIVGNPFFLGDQTMTTIYDDSCQMLQV